MLHSQCLQAKLLFYDTQKVLGKQQFYINIDIAYVLKRINFRSCGKSYQEIREKKFKQ